MLGKGFVSKNSSPKGLEFLDKALYQDDFLIPGISPLFANSRKHIRQRPKSRIYPRLRPQRKQRRTTLDLYLGGFKALAITDCLAMFAAVQI